MTRATISALMHLKNEKHILSLINKGPISRVEIAKQTGLTKAAFTIIVDDLKQRNVDFDNNVIYINHKVTTPCIDGAKKIDAKDGAKTKSSVRALSLTEILKVRLLEIKEKQKMYQKKFKRSYIKEWLDYVMVDKLGNLILPDYISSSFKLVLEKNNLRHIRFHDLRHTCASLLLNKGKQKGVDLKDIQVWLGHSDFATTANIYSHLDATSKTNSLSALEGVVAL